MSRATSRVAPGLAGLDKLPGPWGTGPAKATTGSWKSPSLLQRSCLGSR